MNALPAAVVAVPEPRSVDEADAEAAFALVAPLVGALRAALFSCPKLIR
jgi:hypothetical protein